MSAFDDLKKATQDTVTTDKVVAESWLKKYRYWLIAIGAVSLLFLAIGKGWL